MDSSIRPPYAPHTLHVRTPNGTVLVVEAPPVYQPKLAVQNAFALARQLRSCSDTVSVGCLCDAQPDDLENDPDVEVVNPLECTVEVWRRVPDGYRGSVNGYALLCEVPVAPAVPQCDPEPARPDTSTHGGSQ